MIKHRTGVGRQEDRAKREGRWEGGGGAIGVEIGAINYAEGWNSRETRTAPFFFARFVDTVPWNEPAPRSSAPVFAHASFARVFGTHERRSVRRLGVRENTRLIARYEYPCRASSSAGPFGSTRHASGHHGSHYASCFGLTVAPNFHLKRPTGVACVSNGPRIKF
ncbi:hypothetical protein KM043_004102 [Ampulex compressa]|nr:hypothetical protein KM043_004102 [Ampulex compressa]